MAEQHRNGTPALLDVSGLVKDFPVGRGLFGTKGVVHAVQGVSFSLSRGETLAVVGESGCGKSTLARCVLRLLVPTEGTITFEGVDITDAPASQLRPLRRDAAMVFQDPFGSLNPRLRVGSIVGEPLREARFGSKSEIQDRIWELFTQVGLNPEHFSRFPHEFSGGQRQRIGIARALALHPKLLVCDEPVSALDVSAQAQILNLLGDLRDSLHLSYLFITHNLDIVRRFCDRVLVMYLGRVMETATVAELFAAPRHPYTAALLAATPIPNPRLTRARGRTPLTGDPPSPLSPPTGCPFHPRCPRAQQRCRDEVPPLMPSGGSHSFACHFPLEPATTS
ncbi:MAG TPA: oligopeptide/dipeptide ABC transporter ATP-binding protein [Solirubrobacteraceae bacterium]|nr:oligopeptide/dipeptide ABC transporter ATP-binding protein [Solirubrobacteraceae bacterium]